MRCEGQTMGRHGNIAGVMLVALMIGGSAGGADSVNGADGGRSLPNWIEAGDEAVRNLANIIKIDTSSGNETKVARYIKAILDKEGMMKQLRANRYYEKPREQRRRKAARARSRVLSGR